MESGAGRVEVGGFALSFVAVLGLEKLLEDEVVERRLYGEVRMYRAQQGVRERRPGLRPA